MNRTTARALSLLAAVPIALLAPVAGCAIGPREPAPETVDGYIQELEHGRNGVKIEVKDGDASVEHYLIPNTVCTQGANVGDCADADDFLVPRTDAKPGLNHTSATRPSTSSR